MMRIHVSSIELIFINLLKLTKIFKYIYIYRIGFEAKKLSNKLTNIIF